MKNNSQFSILDSQFLTEDDFDRLSALDKLCVGAEGWSADSFRSEVAKDNGRVFFVRDGDEIVALLAGYAAVGEADITSLAVAPEYRRRGLAEGLIRAFEDSLPGYPRDIFLEVRESNAPAIALYEKCGFKRLSVRKNFYSSPDEDAVVMRKILEKR